MSRKNHLVPPTDVREGNRAVALCGVVFTVDMARNVFEHEDCQRCDKAAKARGHNVVRKTYPLSKVRTFSTELSFKEA